jgi:WD40 repeat protein
VKHSSRSIDAMSWSNDGATLCTGDNTGYVSIWQVDDRTRPVFKCDVEVPEQLAKKKCKVTHISQTPTSFLKENDDTSSSPATSFLITYQSHERGSLMRCVCVFGADTTEDSFCHAVTLFETETTIETVLVDDGFGKNENKKGGDKNTPAIVTLSADASLTRHASGDSSKITFDESRVAKKQHQSAQWTQTCHFKLPVDSVSFETVCVAHANVVAVVSVNDPSCAIRMFDLVDGSMFFLRPFPELVGDESVNNKTQKPDRYRTEAGGAKRRLTCVVRDSVTGALACGGGDGTIVVFKPTGGERDTGNDLGKHAMAGLGVKNIMNSPGHRPRKGRRAMTSPGKSENTLESHGATGDAEARDGSGRDDDDGVTGDLKNSDQDPARGWRLLATTTTDAAVTSLRFAPGPSSKVLVATVFREHSGGTREAADSGNTGSTAKKNQNQSTGVLVLSKTRLADKVRQNVSLAHVSASALLVESTTGKFDPRLFRSSGGSVFGADSTDTCLLLWTAKVRAFPNSKFQDCLFAYTRLTLSFIHRKHAETHVFGEHGYEKVARFPHHPPVNAAEVPHGISVARKTLVGGATATRSFIGAQTMALSGCGRVVYRPGRGAGVVEACELSGSSRDVLGFESTHGVCSHLDVNGEFLVCATSVGWVHLWWLGGRYGLSQSTRTASAIAHTRR